MAVVQHGSDGWLDEQGARSVYQTMETLLDGGARPEIINPRTGENVLNIAETHHAQAIGSGNMLQRDLFDSITSEILRRLGDTTDEEQMDTWNEDETDEETTDEETG